MKPKRKKTPAPTPKSPDLTKDEKQLVALLVEGILSRRIAAPDWFYDGVLRALILRNAIFDESTDLENMRIEQDAIWRLFNLTRSDVLGLQLDVSLSRAGGAA